MKSIWFLIKYCTGMLGYVFIRYTNSKNASYDRKEWRNGRENMEIWQERWA